MHALVLYLGPINENKVNIINTTQVEHDYLKYTKSRVLNEEPFCEIKELNPKQIFCDKRENKDCVQ